MTRWLPYAHMALLLALLILVSPVLCSSPADAQDGFSTPELVVGTKEAPPFAIKSDKGEWSGISIELWRKLADQLKLR